MCPKLHTLCFAVHIAGLLAGPSVLNAAPDAVATQVLPAGTISLEKDHARYNEATQMLRRPFSSPGYHTTLTGGDVHPTRDSLAYAVALLDTRDANWTSRAEGVIRAVLRLQDQNPEHKTYGIWPWFLEEPLEKMSPPDWNWADFCGVQLLQIARDHAVRLEPKLAGEVELAIRHAAASIRRRDVGPGYTNIALMGTYVTLCAGELFDDRDLHAYGMNRLLAIHEHSVKSGALSEYNSPTYTIIALQEIARMKAHVRAEAAKPLIEALYHRVWQEIATHYHVPSRQWAGPHSRTYNTLLGRTTLALLGHSTGGKMDLPEDIRVAPENAKFPTPCPAEFVPYFTTFDAARSHVQTFEPGEFPLVGTTWLAPDFTIGTCNHADMWNQRRPLLAYWLVEGKPAYLRVRFLNNHYDLAAARLTCAQKKGQVLAGISFATDGGNRHNSLDRIQNASFLSRDLRLRFELGGAASGTTLLAPKAVSAPVLLESGKLSLSLAVPFAQFGKFAGKWRVSRPDNQDVVALDCVFLENAASDTAVALEELEAAAIGFALAISTQPGVTVAPSAQSENGLLKLTWPSAGLKVSTPFKPAKSKYLRSTSRSSYDGPPA